MESWDRNNVVMINVLRAIADGALGARAMVSSPTVDEMLAHMHHERIISVFENAPEYAGQVPEVEWSPERDAHRNAQLLSESGKRVRDAGKGRVEAGQALDRDFAHPSQLLLFGSAECGVREWTCCS
jgi:hypothetical protein